MLYYKKTMKTDQIIMCVVALLLGMLLANMLKNVCGCKVIEGQGNEACFDEDFTFDRCCGPGAATADCFPEGLIGEAAGGLLTKDRCCPQGFCAWGVGGGRDDNVDGLDRYDTFPDQFMSWRAGTDVDGIPPKQTDCGKCILESWDKQHASDGGRGADDKWESWGSAVDRDLGWKKAWDRCQNQTVLGVGVPVVAESYDSGQVEELALAAVSRQDSGATRLGSLRSFGTVVGAVSEGSAAALDVTAEDRVKFGWSVPGERCDPLQKAAAETCIENCDTCKPHKNIVNMILGQCINPETGQSLATNVREKCPQDNECTELQSRAIAGCLEDCSKCERQVAGGGSAMEDYETLLAGCSINGESIQTLRDTCNTHKAWEYMCNIQLPHDCVKDKNCKLDGTVDNQCIWAAKPCSEDQTAMLKKCNSDCANTACSRNLETLLGACTIPGFDGTAYKNHVETCESTQCGHIQQPIYETMLTRCDAAVGGSQDPRGRIVLGGCTIDGRAAQMSISECHDRGGVAGDYSAAQAEVAAGVAGEGPCSELQLAEFARCSQDCSCPGTSLKILLGECTLPNGPQAYDTYRDDCPCWGTMPNMMAPTPLPTGDLRAPTIAEREGCFDCIVDHPGAHGWTGCGGCEGTGECTDVRADTSSDLFEISQENLRTQQAAAAGGGARGVTTHYPGAR